MSDEPAATAHVIVEGPSHDGTRFPLREGITSFGRLPGNDVILLGDLVSRHHARIAYFEGRATLQDLNSHNGCFVNGDRVDARLLEDGDEVRIGNFSLVFRRGAPAESERETASPEPLPPDEPGRLIDEIQAARRGEPSPTRALHFLYRATSALAASPDRRRYGAEMLALALEHTGGDHAAWVSERGGALEVEAEVGVRARGLPMAAIRWAIDRQTPVRSPDLGRDERFVGAGGGAALAVPFDADDGRHALAVDGVEGLEAEDLARLGVVAHLLAEGLVTLAARDGAAASTELAPRSVDGMTLIVLDLHRLSAVVPPERAREAARLVESLHTEARRQLGALDPWVEPMNGHRLLVGLGRSRPLSPDRTAEALDAVLTLRTRIDALVAAAAESPTAFEGVRLRAGVSTGEAVVGSASGRSFAIGPAAASATRLLEASVGGRILVDAVTLDRAQPPPPARRVGQEAARGRLPARPVFELVGQRG